MAEFLKEPVLEALHGVGRPLKAKELARELKVGGDDYREFRDYLRGLVASGELYQVKNGRFAPPDRINLIVGHLAVIRSGAAFLIPEKGETTSTSPPTSSTTPFTGTRRWCGSSIASGAGPRDGWSACWSGPARSSWARWSAGSTS